ncbi:MAG: hypothetical protein H6713_40620 [Myxococcales bacterium]|nr:hypothetical protein [Myxococcales bacterium]
MDTDPKTPTPTTTESASANAAEPTTHDVPDHLIQEAEVLPTSVRETYEAIAQRHAAHGRVYADSRGWLLPGSDFARRVVGALPPDRVGEKAIQQDIEDAARRTGIEPCSLADLRAHGYVQGRWGAARYHQAGCVLIRVPGLSGATIRYDGRSYVDGRRWIMPPARGRDWETTIAAGPESASRVWIVEGLGDAVLPEHAGQRWIVLGGCLPSETGRQTALVYLRIAIEAGQTPILCLDTGDAPKPRPEIGGIEIGAGEYGSLEMIEWLSRHAPDVLERLQVVELTDGRDLGDYSADCAAIDDAERIEAELASGAVPAAQWADRVILRRVSRGNWTTGQITAFIFRFGGLCRLLHAQFAGKKESVLLKDEVLFCSAYVGDRLERHDHDHDRRGMSARRLHATGRRQGREGVGRDRWTGPAGQRGDDRWPARVRIACISWSRTWACSGARSRSGAAKSWRSRGLESNGHTD